MKSLYIVATPIGNLKDITLRALEVLRAVPVIIAERPQHSKKLFLHHDINPQKLLQYTEANRKRMIPAVLGLLENEEIALVVDAGTPGLSDPGAELVQAVREAGGKVIPIPGPAAFAAAFSVSGIPLDKLLFVGFLPRKESHLVKLLKQFSDQDLTIAGYEAPHRILKTLEAVANFFPDLNIVLAKELTKMHEAIFAGTAATILERVKSEKKGALGEFVILFDLRRVRDL